MNLGQLIVLASAYVAGVLFSLRPIGRRITRDSTIDPHEMAGLVVVASLAWPAFWVCAFISEVARRHLREIRRYEDEIAEQARKAYGGTD